jgi:uncharacterized protein
MRDAIIDPNNRPDYDGAQRYALHRLEGLSPDLIYHSITHTRDDVVPAAERLAVRERVVGEDRLLLLTAAWFHDIGFVEQAADHELISIRIAREALPAFGYTPQQLQIISDLILATRLPQSPHTLMEAILVDSDLDVLGRPDYPQSHQKLRQEMAVVNGIHHTDKEWYLVQQDFLSNHEYFTAAARALRDNGKARNLAGVRVRLAELSRN